MPFVNMEVGLAWLGIMIGIGGKTFVMYKVGEKDHNIFYSNPSTEGVNFSNISSSVSLFINTTT